MKNFVYKDIGQHGHSYQAPKNQAPKPKLTAQSANRRTAIKLHKRILRSLTLARPDRLV